MQQMLECVEAQNLAFLEEDIKQNKPTVDVVTSAEDINVHTFKAIHCIQLKLDPPKENGKCYFVTHL